MVDINTQVQDTAARDAAVAKANSGNSKGASSVEDAFGLSFEDLLLLQLETYKHQDPLSPSADASELSKQVADLTTVDQLQDINKGISSLGDLTSDNNSAINILNEKQNEILEAANLTSSAVSGLSESQSEIAGLNDAALTNIEQSRALDLIGKQYLASTEKVEYAGNDVDIYYYVPADTETLSINVRDASGNILWSDNGSSQEGLYDITWDGRDNNGDLVAQGSYDVEVIATDDEGGAQTVDAFVYKQVKSVESVGKDVYLVFGDKTTVPLSDSFSVKL